MIHLKISQDSRYSSLTELSNAYANFIQLDVDKRLKNENKRNTDRELRAILNYLKNKIPALLGGELSFLEKENAAFNTRFSSLNLSRKIGKKKIWEIIVDTLGYDKIRKNYAHWFVDNLGLRSCPYCNSQYLLNISGLKDKRSLCQLDHYLPRSSHPIVAISFFNLIPVCSYCNHRKGNKKFDFYPYNDGIDSLMHFATDPLSVLNHLLNGNKIELILKYDKTNQSLKYFVEVLSLEDLYQNHNSAARDLYLKRLFYHSSRRTEILDFFKGNGIPFTNSDVDRFILGRHIDVNSLGKEPLAKMTKDIWEELNLIPI